MAHKEPGAFRHALLSLRRDIGMLRAAFAAVDVAPACAEPHRHNREWCAVYLNDSWQRFCRRLVLSSAVLEPVSLSGKIVRPVPGLRSQRETLAALRRVLAPKRPAFWEPRWHDAIEAGRAVRVLGVSNASQIIAALGSTPSPAADLNTVRNFIAHRNRDTAGKLSSVLLKYRVATVTGSSSRAVVDMLLVQPMSGDPCFVGWCNQLEGIATACVT